MIGIKGCYERILRDYPKCPLVPAAKDSLESMDKDRIGWGLRLESSKSGIQMRGGPQR